MIRQAINCDMCGAEKQSVTSHWFVAYELGGELKLRGWESPKNSRKNVKHLCGQKCAQRMTANFTAAVMAAGHGTETEKDLGNESSEQNTTEFRDREDRPALERMGYDRTTATLIEAESWAGPVKPRESSWETDNKLKVEREQFLHSTNRKTPVTRRFPPMA